MWLYYDDQLVDTETLPLGKTFAYGAGTYSFDPEDYIPHNERANYTITKNENGTWTVSAG